jgi:hypothetical protein
VTDQKRTLAVAVIAVSAAVIAVSAMVLTIVVASRPTPVPVPAPALLLPTVKVFDNVAVESGIRSVLAPGHQIDNVSCPADRPVKAGTTFTCTATVDGQKKNIVITAKDDNGKYEVAQPS